MTSTEDVYRAHNSAENDHNLVQPAGLVNPSLVVAVNDMAALASGNEDARANAKLIACYPDHRREIVEIVVDGESAAVHWWIGRTATAEVAKEFGELDIHSRSVLQADGGRIVSAHLYANPRVMDALLARSPEATP